MIKRIAILTVSVAALLGCLLGCEESEEELTPTVVARNKKTDSPTTAQEVKDAESSYSYDMMVNGAPRRDPFKTYFDELNADEMRDTSRLTELQKIDLDRLKLVAVVVGTATPMALVEDQSGKGHTLKIGTLVGKKLGQVKHIRRGEVVVQEEFRDFSGKRIPQLKEMRLDAPANP